MEKNKAKLLLQKYLLGNCTEEEKALLESWYLQQNLDLMQDIEEAERKSDLREVFDKLESEYHYSKRISLWPKIAVAASILLAVSIGLYFYMDSTTIKKVHPTHQYAKQIQPGSNKAILILADGEKISLDDAKVGELATQSDIKIAKTADGQIIYTINNSSDKPAYGFNTIETPRGGQYQVNLPDGTKVWLNAASTLRYPTKFSGSKREVQLSGEAYFEVAKDKTKPFMVISDEQVVEVLGTHFNINNYKDEVATETTLLEGSVKVTQSNTNKSLLLTPGNQSLVSKQKISLKDADVEEVVSWKNGQFIFINESLGSIMRKLSRWYDVDVVYEGDIANKTFSGTISKYTNVTEVLNTLELTRSVQFEIEGTTITA